MTEKAQHIQAVVPAGNTTIEENIPGTDSVLSRSSGEEKGGELAPQRKLAHRYADH